MPLLPAFTGDTAGPKVRPSGELQANVNRPFGTQHFTAEGGITGQRKPSSQSVPNGIP
jgi:hypothetical protein